MSYWVTFREASFAIPKKSLGDAFAVLKRTHVHASSLNTLLKDLGFTFILDGGDLHLTSFCSEGRQGDLCLHDDQEKALVALAPFMSNGSWIEYESGDGIYRRAFVDGKMHIVEGKVEFEMPEPKKYDLFWAVVLVEGGIPRSVWLRASYGEAVAKAQQIVQSDDYNNEDDCVQVFDTSLNPTNSGTALLSNAKIDDWLEGKK